MVLETPKSYLINGKGMHQNITSIGGTEGYLHTIITERHNIKVKILILNIVKLVYNDNNSSIEFEIFSKKYLNKKFQDTGVVKNIDISIGKPQ